MKNRFCLFLLILLSAWRLGAVPVTVSGLVSYPDGSPATEWTVMVGEIDPATGTGLTTITDVDGFYSTEIDLPAGESTVQVQTADPCGILQSVLVPIINGQASADFILCDDPGWNECYAYGYGQLGENLGVQFYGQAYGPDSTATFTYLWDFGDGTTSTEQNPSHTYAEPGFYTVSLLATSGDCAVQSLFVINVYPAQEVNVSGHVYNQDGGPVPSWFVLIDTGDPTNGSFYGNTDAQGFYSIAAYLPETATSVTATTWDFCSPNGVSGTANIVNGAATIDLTICYDSIPPIPNCGAEITYALIDTLTYQFTAKTYAVDSNATFTYLWDFGDGTTSTEQNPVHTYATDGVYSVLLTATTDNGCAAQACDVICTFGGGGVDTFYYGCQAMYTVGWGGDPATGLFDPFTLTFYDLSFGIVGSWHWDFGDSSTSTLQNPVHTYAQSGLYTVTLHITTVDGCESEISMEVYAGDGLPGTEFDCQAMFLPIPDSTGNGFYFLNLSLTLNPTVSYEWDFGDGSTSTEINPYHAYAEPGVYTVTLDMTADSCNSTISFELDTESPFGVFRPENTVLGLASGTSGLKTLPVVSGLKAFPNPASDETTLAFNSLLAQDLELRLSSLSGQVLSSQAVVAAGGPQQVRLPLRDLTPGLYLLQVRSARGVQTLKLVKE